MNSSLGAWIWYSTVPIAKAVKEKGMIRIYMSFSATKKFFTYPIAKIVKKKRTMYHSDWNTKLVSIESSKVQES